MENSSDIRLLQADIDADDISEFRIQIGSHYIKYVTIAPGIYDIMDLVFEPALEKILCAILPTGDWTQAMVSMANRCSEDVSERDLPIIVKVSKPSFPGIRRAWHPVKIEYLELQIGTRLQSNVYQASHSCFSRPIVVKFARFAWEIKWLEAETAAYGWIDGHGIGPDFLGNVTEHGRVIGFILSQVENARHATPPDYIRCREALQVLHGMKIKHGDINRHNFLLHSGGVTLIDFDAAVQNSQSLELRDELEHLEEQLNDTSGRGAPITYCRDR